MFTNRLKHFCRSVHISAIKDLKERIFSSQPLCSENDNTLSLIACRTFMNAAEQAAEQGFSGSQGSNLSKKLVALTTGSATQEESEDKNGSRLVAPCIWAEPLI